MKIYNELEEIDDQYFEIIYFELTDIIQTVDQIIQDKNTQLKKGYDQEKVLGVIRFTISYDEGIMAKQLEFKNKY